MNFLVVAHDYTEKSTLAKRAELRTRHQARIKDLARSKSLMNGGVILSGGNPIGSAFLFELPDRSSLDAVLAADPYMAGGVWERIEVYDLAIPNPAGMTSR
ncbi:YciI family protein [Phyllobacterium sp. SB3]|uniref:YciI family protein n=1 Tax=Phyllobacterium sp. SB3 TaxID=3156073 RepID=UPI0032AEC1BF